jgi:hypothetical protein
VKTDEGSEKKLEEEEEREKKKRKKRRREREFKFKKESLNEKRGEENGGKRGEVRKLEERA